MHPQIRRELPLFAPIYFFLAFICLRVKLFLTPDWFDTSLISESQRMLLSFTFSNNEQSRLLQFYIPEFIHRVLRVPIEDAYLIQRWLFVWLTFIVFHHYLRKWFSKEASFAGVAFLAAIMPLTYFSHMQESAPLLMLTFLLGLWAIREKRDGLFALVLLVGALNNETILALSGAYFLFRFVSFRSHDLINLCTKAFLVSIPAWGSVVFIRYLTRDNPHLGGWWHLPMNMTEMLRDLGGNPLHWHYAFYLYIFFLFGALWVYAFMQWNQKDFFLRRVSLLIPLFIGVHFLFGVIYEVRQMIPLAFIVIPMAMQYMFSRPHEKDPRTKIQEPR